MAERPEDIISAAGFPVYLHGFSAIDSYLGGSAASAVHILCGADLASLARLFDNLRYPGTALADAAVDCDGKTWYFRCEELRDKPVHRASFGFLEFYQDCTTGRFYDPNGIYPHLRRIRDGASDNAQWTEVAQPRADDSKCDVSQRSEERRALFDAALILAKYFPHTSVRELRAIATALQGHNNGPPPGAEEQRLLLIGLLEAPTPATGFELLKNCGFIATHWQELAALDEVDHSKEYHPEGNVWKHTMEALRYRKAAGGSFDLRLSLGLLLHDSGKPHSAATGSRRFDGHAELGVRQARRFLDRLGFDELVIHDVCYLVRNHMMPAALPRLPLIRTGEILASPLFPALLELYRCDESSSFKGLDGYYQSSAAYQSYLKHRRNPYRSDDGKKLRREQIICR